MKKIHLVGLNHKTATVEIRERFALSEQTTPELWPFAKIESEQKKILKKNCACSFSKNKQNNAITNKATEESVPSYTSEAALLAATDIIKIVEDTNSLGALEQNNFEASYQKKKLAVHEALILSTCNRVEIIASHDGSADDILKAWSDAKGFDIEDLRPYVYVYEGKDAVTHLFRVASSLDSLVLGEPQILGQLKSAYRLSVEANHAGLMINKLLHKSFSVAKRVRTETGVASNAVSISYAAVELAKRIFDDMDKHEALLVGAGEMAELAAMHLMANGISKLCIVNRTFARAEELAVRIGGEALAFESLTDCLVNADIVITSTGSTEPIIHSQMMTEVMKQRKNRPMFLIDIAMPRDIDPSVNNLDSVYVYDIDDLKEVVEENLAQRKDEALKAAAIIAYETEDFETWRGSLAMKPTILDIEAKGRSIVEIETQRTLKQLEKQGISIEGLEDSLLKMANAIVRKCHHAPLAHLVQSYRHNHNTKSVEMVRQVLELDKNSDII